MMQTRVHQNTRCSGGWCHPFSSTPTDQDPPVLFLCVERLPLSWPWQKDICLTPQSVAPCCTLPVSTSAKSDLLCRAQFHLQTGNQRWESRPMVLCAQGVAYLSTHLINHLSVFPFRQVSGTFVSKFTEAGWLLLLYSLVGTHPYPEAFLTVPKCHSTIKTSRRAQDKRGNTDLSVELCTFGFSTPHTHSFMLFSGWEALVSHYLMNNGQRAKVLPFTWSCSQHSKTLPKETEPRAFPTLPLHHSREIHSQGTHRQ